MVVTKRGGTRFLTLKDWPVEERHGVRTVATLEEYLDGKFVQIAESLERLTQRVDALERQVTVLEQAHRQLEGRIDQVEPEQP